MGRPLVQRPYKPRGKPPVPDYFTPTEELILCRLAQAPHSSWQLSDAIAAELCPNHTPFTLKVQIHVLRRKLKDRPELGLAISTEQRRYKLVKARASSAALSPAPVAPLLIRTYT